MQIKEKDNNNKEDDKHREENILLNIVRDMAESATDRMKTKKDVDHRNDSNILEGGSSEERAVKDLFKDKQEIYFTNTNADIIKRSEIPLDVIEIVNNTEKKDTKNNHKYFSIRKINPNEKTGSLTLDKISEIQKLKRSKVSKIAKTKSSPITTNVKPIEVNKNNKNFQTDNNKSKQWRTTQSLYQSSLELSHKDASIEGQNPDTKVVNIYFIIFDCRLNLKN